MNRMRSPRPPRGASVALMRALDEIRRQKRIADAARPAAEIAQRVIGHVGQVFGGPLPRPRRAPR